MALIFVVSFGIFAILFSNFHHLVIACSGFENENLSTNQAHQMKPKMDLRIDQPTRYYAMNKYVHKLKPNVVLVNMTGVLQLRLDCWAPYPIDMQFSGHLTNQETTVKTFRKDFGPEDKNHSCFIMNATMETYEEITGNYSCVSVENPAIIESYYIFVSMNPPGVLLTRGQTITIQVKPHDKEIIFPCAVSHPDVHVQLLQGNTAILLSTNLKYDPKIGFTLKIDWTHFRDILTFTCLTELSPKDRVNFTILPPEPFEVDPPMNHIKLSSNDQLKIKCRATEDFIITTNPDSIPHVKNQVDHEANNEFYQFVGSFESKLLPERTTGSIACRWKTTNEAFYEWTFSVLDTVKPGHLDISKFKTECPRTSDIILFECSNFIECKINSCVRKDAKCQSNSHYCQKDKSCMHNGLIQCPIMGRKSSQVSEIFFTAFPFSSISSNKTNRYVEWKHAAEDELLLLKKLSPEFSTDTRIKFSCQGSNFVFSSGFKWYLVHVDGTRSELSTVKGNQMNISVNNSWKEKKSNLESTLSLPLTSNLESILPHLTYIECSAPVWNSWEWKSQRIPINSNMFQQRSFSQKKNSATNMFGKWKIVSVLLITPLHEILKSTSA